MDDLKKTDALGTGWIYIEEIMDFIPLRQAFQTRNGRINKYSR